MFTDSCELQRVLTSSVERILWLIRGQVREWGREKERERENIRKKRQERKRVKYKR